MVGASFRTSKITLSLTWRLYYGGAAIVGTANKYFYCFLYVGWFMDLHVLEFCLPNTLTSVSSVV